MILSPSTRSYFDSSIADLRRRFDRIPRNFDPTCDLQKQLSELIERFFDRLDPKTLSDATETLRPLLEDLQPHFQSRYQVLDEMEREMCVRMNHEHGKHRKEELRSLIEVIVRAKSGYIELQDLLTELCEMR